MSRTPLDILNLFVTPPGDLLFFLLVIAFSQGALFLAYGHRARFAFEPATRRYLMAAAALVVVWLAMLGASALAQAAAIDANRFMPPLERLAYAVTLCILAWAFLSADALGWRNRSNLMVAGAGLALALLYLFTAADWLDASPGQIAFNTSSLAPLWSALTLAIAIAGALLALLNMRGLVDAPLKVLFFLSLALGNGFDLFQLSQGEAAGSYLGGARLAYVAGLALLPLIIHRFSVALLENSLVEVVLAASQPLSQTPAEALSPTQDALPESSPAWNTAASDARKLLNAIAAMLDQDGSLALPERVVRAAQAALNADVCLLLLANDKHYADIVAGYDRVADVSLSGLALNLREQPTLLEACARGEPTILFPEYHGDELGELFRRLSLSPLSKVYVQPLQAKNESQAALLVSLPYRQVDLSMQDIECLRDIGSAAGHILAWTAAQTQSSQQAEARRLDEIAALSAEPAADREALRANRQELESKLEPLLSPRAGLEAEIADLRGQLQQQQVRLLDRLAASDDPGGESGLAAQLNAAFDEQARLGKSCQDSARDLLDAETVLRALNIDSGETLVQVIREYLHKQGNLMESARDRLRRQLNAALVISKSSAAEGVDLLMQSLRDENAQLELEREQQGRRLESLRARLESLGFSAAQSNMTQLLLQMHAERQTFSGQLKQAKDDRASLLKETRRLKAADGGDRADLERQLARLSADHDQLLNGREEMRRENQELQSKLDAAAEQYEQMRAGNAQLGDDLAAQANEQATLKQRIEEMADERDNLLTLRDQLRAKVAAAMEQGGASAALGDEIAELRAKLSRLTTQRDELALALSDARGELRAARDGEHAAPVDPAEANGRAPWQASFLGDFIGDMRSPLSSLSDYSSLLLAESLGILGAAQQQVLRLMMDDLGRLARGLDALREAAQLDAELPGRPPEAADLTAVIDEIMRSCLTRLNEKEIQVELALADHLPPVSVDESSLRQILSRLLENAIAVSPPGSTISIGAEMSSRPGPDEPAPAESLEISVRDCGGGIAVHDLPRLFARKYSSAYPSIAGYSDTGVSMSIARAYLRAKGGELWVTSADGGAVFHLALPMRLAPSLEE